MNNLLRTLCVSLGLVLLPLLSRAQQLDSTRLAPLDSLLGEYYRALVYEPLEVKYAECDFLISSCKDTLVRQWVTGRILEHYMEPPLMGEEAVEIYVYDKWVASGEVTIQDDWLSFETGLFAEFNRNSLLGMKAPVLSLLPPSGSEKVRVPGESGLSVLYFYDTSCSKCVATSSMLPYVLEAAGVPLTLYAVYTGTDGDEWAEFRAGFSVPSDDVKVVHLWDPEMESDYQRQYGVLSTPKMFLVDSDGIIQGRRLEADSLAQLLQIYRF